MVESGWNLPAPPGFQGLREDLPLKTYHRNLPHWRQDGATYFVTFRLADSLPQNKLRQLRAMRTEWEQKHPPPRSDQEWEELARETFRRVEHWLDQGFGSCLLRQSTAVQHTLESLLFFDGQRYELGCAVVMPNHVHVVLRPLCPTEFPVEKILQSCKRHSAQAINTLRGEAGSIWQEESFDRIVRDEEHLYRCVQYIGRNPRKASVAEAAKRLWISPKWVELGWRFEQGDSNG